MRKCFGLNDDNTTYRNLSDAFVIVLRGKWELWWLYEKIGKSYIEWSKLLKLGEQRTTI